jgi:hypothetical protein
MTCAQRLSRPSTTCVEVFGNRRKRKAAYGPKLAELIRLTKWWVRQARNIQHPDLKFKSFMIELLWAKLADNGLDLSDYPAALEACFGYVVRTEFDDIMTFDDYTATTILPTRGASPIEVIDPVNTENNVAVRYDARAKKLIVEACNDALDAVSEARFATTTRAVDAWQAVLGPSFRI